MVPCSGADAAESHDEQDVPDRYSLQRLHTLAEHAVTREACAHADSHVSPSNVLQAVRLDAYHWMGINHQTMNSIGTAVKCDASNCMLFC